MKNNENKLIILLFFIFFFINSTSQSEENLKTKRMIVILIPGGHTHNYVIQNLFDYSISHEDKYKYEYHIISHRIDSRIWEDKIKNDNKKNS